MAEPMDREKTVELLRLLSTDLTELANRIEAAVDPDTDSDVRDKWDDVSETMNSVFAVLASDDEFDAKMEDLVSKEMEEHPQLSREEAEEIVLQHMSGNEDDDGDGGDDEYGEVVEE